METVNNLKNDTSSDTLSGVSTEMIVSSPVIDLTGERYVLPLDVVERLSATLSISGEVANGPNETYHLSDPINSSSQIASTKCFKCLTAKVLDYPVCTGDVIFQDDTNIHVFGGVAYSDSGDNQYALKFIVNTASLKVSSRSCTSMNLNVLIQRFKELEEGKIRFNVNEKILKQINSGITTFLTSMNSDSDGLPELYDDEPDDEIKGLFLY